MNNEELRAAYGACLPLLTAWYTDLGQRARLYHAYQAVLRRKAATCRGDSACCWRRRCAISGSPAWRCPTPWKQQFKALTEKLSTVCSRFDDNVLDATNAWNRHITDSAQLAGLPQPIIERARAAAEAKDLQGWLFSLDAPNYLAAMTHAVSDTLRREFYTGWVTRASDQGPGQWDNSALMEEILSLRHARADLVGFRSFAEYSLATKMADSVQQVEAFLKQVADLSRPAARRELDELQQFAGRDLNAWDIAYYSEKLKQQRFTLSEEALRPYFPLPRVLSGLFTVASMLYGIRIVERQDVDLYHPDVRFFDILEQDGSRRAASISIFTPAPASGEAPGWTNASAARASMPGARNLWRILLQFHAACAGKAVAAADALRGRHAVP